MAQINRTNLSNILVLVGLLMMAIMAVTPLLVNHDINMELMRWIFTAGAFLVLVGRLINIYRGTSLRTAVLRQCIDDVRFPRNQ